MNKKLAIIAVFTMMAGLGGSIFAGVQSASAAASFHYSNPHPVEIIRISKSSVHRVGFSGSVLDRDVSREFFRSGPQVKREVKLDVHRVGPRGGVLDRKVFNLFKRNDDGSVKRIIKRDVLRVFPNGRVVERHVNREVNVRR